MKSGSLYSSASVPLFSGRSLYKNGQTNDNNNYSENYSDRDSIISGCRGKRTRPRRLSNTSMKLTKTMSKKTKGMDYTNYNYNTAVNRLKFLLAESYTPNKQQNFSYSKNLLDDSGEDTDNQSIAERPVLSEISKYLSPNYSAKGLRSSGGLSKKFKPYSSSTTSGLSKENLLTAPNYTTASDYLTATPAIAVTSATALGCAGGGGASGSDSIQAPTEILSFIEKQEDYIEQLEKESKFCRNELSNLLGKVKDVIHENEALTEHARSDLARLGREPNSSESDDISRHYDKPTTSSSLSSNKKKSPRHLSGPNIVFESRISELEADVAQSNIDLKKLRSENDDLKRKIASGSGSGMNCEVHRKQIETLQKDKNQLEDQIRRLQHTIDDLRTENTYNSSKRHLSDMAVIERSQADLEVKHLRDELDRQHERVRELQHEMARRVSDERCSAERRYNLQVDQLGGDLSSQWEQVSKLQMDLERQKRVEVDLKRDISQRNGQIEELKLELKNKRTGFLTDIAQVNAEKQSLEQEITSLRLQLDRADRSAKIEAARLNAEINSLRQRLDRADADVLHAKRENLRLGDEIANLEKEVTLGEMKNEVRPTRKDIDKSFQEMQEKHAGTVTELEEMIQNQRHLMDKLTGECKTLTNKLEDTSLKHKMEIAALQSNVEYLTNRVINSDRISKTTTNNNSNNNHDNNNIISSYSSSSLPQSKAPIEYESALSTSDSNRIIGNLSNTDALLRGTNSGGDESISLSSKPYEYKSSLDLGKSSPLLSNSSNQRLETTTGINESMRSDIAPYTPHNTTSAYNYGEDENSKDQFGEGNKFNRNGLSGLGTTRVGSINSRSPSRVGSITDTTSSPYSPTQLGDTTTNKLYSTTKEKLHSSPVITGGTSSIEPQYEESNPTTDYSQYQTEGYEGYDPQQYDTSGYEGEYEQQQYDGSQQQYDGTGQYEGNGQQYEGYGQEYEQSYQQPDISSYEQQLQQQPQTLPQSQLPSVTSTTLSNAAPPSPITSTLTTGAIGTINSPIKTGLPSSVSTIPDRGSILSPPKSIESRSQPRTSPSTVGQTGAGLGGGDKGSNLLSQQSAQNFKGLSSISKN